MKTKKKMRVRLSKKRVRRCFYHARHKFFIMPHRRLDVRVELLISWTLTRAFVEESDSVRKACWEGSKKSAVDIGSGAGPLGTRRTRRDIQVGFPNEKAARGAASQVRGVRAGGGFECGKPGLPKLEILMTKHVTTRLSS